MTATEILTDSLRALRDRGDYDLDTSDDRALFRMALRRATDHTTVAALKESLLLLAPAIRRLPRNRYGVTYELAERLIDEVRFL
jgi:hypothetical protein